jgi:UDP-N-acetylglucosamine:LPS N-acetylglucosamine transferase
VRVQIVSSKVGGGHQSVAEALRQALIEHPARHVDVWVDDLYLEQARFPASRFPWIYATLTRRFPRGWRLVFNMTNRPPSGPRLNWVGDIVGGPRLRQLIARRQPDVVVTVLPGTTGFVARSVMRSEVQATVEVVATDWADLHLGWASTFPARYTVPTENAAGSLIAAGIPSSDVSVSGFIVREQFVGLKPGPEARCRARQQLGLPADRFLILAMAGTEGSPAALAHLRALVEAPLDADVLVVCGRNRKLLVRLERLAKRLNERPERRAVLRPLGFVQQIADLMLACDLLVTKTGGVTLAEAFCCALPVLAFDPLPGQEEGNARYMVKKGAAELATSPAHLVQLAGELRRSPVRRQNLSKNGHLLASPGAARATADAIVARADGRR